jgi:glutamate synthase (NADPH/NADH) small chain
LTFGIPSFKLEKDVIQTRREILEGMGIEFRLNTNVGTDVSFEAISAEHDAVFLALGTYKDMTGGFVHENAPGVYNALDFLIGNTQNLMGITAEESNQVKPYVNFKDKKVVVLGGGDTAMDCVRTSIRQGANEVTCAYRRDEANMPGSPREVQNAKEEGVNFKFNIQPLDIAIDGNGKAIGVNFVKTQLSEPDANGRRNPEAIPGSEFVMEADAVVIAFGFLPSPPKWMVEAGVELDSRGRVLAIDKSDFALQTTKQNIFAGGDMVLGSDLVVTAIDQGRKAAMGILDYVTLN